MKPGINGINVKLDLEYSYDQENWVVLDMPDADEVYDVNIPFNGHRRVYLRGENLDNYSWGGDYHYGIQSVYNVAIGGNIMSLLNGSDYIGKTEVTNSKIIPFYRRFYSISTIIYSHNLILPALIYQKGYNFAAMFYDCINLITTPKKLPCTTQLTDDYYIGYGSMFSHCRNIIKSPEICINSIVMSKPISYPSQYFHGMFSECYKLKNIKVHFKTVDIDPLIEYGEGHPFYIFCISVASTGDFWMPYDATWNPEEYRGIIVPQNWTIRYFNTITGDEVFPESTLVE